MSDVVPPQIYPRDLAIAEQANRIAELTKLVAEVTQENKQFREENQQIREEKSRSRISRSESRDWKRCCQIKLDAKSSKKPVFTENYSLNRNKLLDPNKPRNKDSDKKPQKNPPVESHTKPKNISSVIRLPSFRQTLIATSAFTIGSSLRGELSTAKLSTCDTIFAISPVRPGCHCRREFATVAATKK